MVRVIYYDNPEEVVGYYRKLLVEGYKCFIDDEAFVREGLNPIADVESDVVESACKEIFIRLEATNSPERSLIIQSLRAHYPMAMRFLSVINKDTETPIACFKKLSTLNVFDLVFSYNQEAVYTILEGEGETETSLDNLVVFLQPKNSRLKAVEKKISCLMSPLPIFLHRLLRRVKRKPLSKVLFLAQDNEYNLYLRPYPAIIEEIKRRQIPFSCISLDDRAEVFFTNHNIEHCSIHDIETFPHSDKQYLEWCTKLSDYVYVKNPANLFEFMINLSLNSATLRDVWLTSRQCDAIKLYIEENNISDIFFVPDGTPIASELAGWASEQGLATHTVLSAGVGKYYRTLENYFSEKIYCQGRASKQSLEYVYTDRKNLIMSGNPNIYTLLNEALEMPENGCRYRVLIATSGFDSREYQWMEALANHINHRSVELILKPHPMYPSRYDRISDAYSNHLILDAEEPLTPYIGAIDLVITDHSQVGVDAHLLGKPVISMYFGEREDLYWSNIDSFYYVSDVDQLLQVIGELKNDASVDISQSFIEEHNFGNNGQYYKRIVEHLEQER